MNVLRTICLGSRCFAKPVPGGILCAPCWERVPGELRDRVAETWAPGPPTQVHKRAIEDAVHSLTRVPLD